MLQDEIKDAYGEDPRNTIVEYLLIKSIKICLPGQGKTKEAVMQDGEAAEKSTITTAIMMQPDGEQ